MSWFTQILHFLSTLDGRILELVNNYGPYTYLILFLILFAETGLVIMPFLPGDSLLFTAGVVASRSDIPLNVGFLFLAFVGGALTGDNVNYFFGRTIGRRLAANPNSKIFKRSGLRKTQAFFEKHGSKALIIARFVPLVRTLAPFVAGMSDLPYKKFMRLSVLAALIWVGTCLFLGYFFGQVPAVKDNFELAMIGIIFVSVVPPTIEVLRHRYIAKRQKVREEEESATINLDA